MQSPCWPRLLGDDVAGDLKGSLQLVTKPTYWEKTVHGLFEQPPVAPEIELLGHASAEHPVPGDDAEALVGADARGETS